MDEYRHLFPPATGSIEEYKYAKKVVRSEFRLPPRDRIQHSQSLISQIEAVENASANAIPSAVGKPKGTVLDFQSHPSFKLQLKSLEFERSGIELRNCRIDDNEVMHASVFIPEGRIGFFVRRFENYAKSDTPKGLPKNNDLVASIDQIRMAALESFWTDSDQFPVDKDHSLWWEVWLCETGTSPSVGNDFRRRAKSIGLSVTERELWFPDRCVLLARASVNELLSFPNLFDILAELRFAKTLAGEFLELAPREQAEFVEESLARITPASKSAPAVCHLDTGVNRGHPLLSLALAEEHLLAVNPDWEPSDGDLQQHGTGMAGLALYGCLTGVFTTTDPVLLRHRLESVKIIPDRGKNDPQLYGEITTQSVARIEIVAPECKQRAFALTITSDCRDQGLPSSWSASLDQICSGADEEDQPRRLMFVSAGNTPLVGRHSYPDHSHINGVQDPAQSWNAITVGAYTDKTLIKSNEFRDWVPVANAGQISPASRTSINWKDRSWPIKPDIVMEGGNLAIDPTTQQADYVDDLMLLTTRTDASGSLLTATADTSAAAALAARYSAIIWSHYPELTPESVRGLLVHSARWNVPMETEFPYDQRHNRLRVYGYGVPNLDRAIRSAKSHATLIVEDSLQPFHQVIGADNSKRIVTKDMRLHRLPWPKKALEQLGGEIVRMRITLSYFVEPSPGRRGWTRKHRYQSHGLRFDVKRPTDMDDNEFLKRISKTFQNEDDDEVQSVSDDRDWMIGPNLRCKGSIHSDVWTGTAAQLAASASVAIYPVTGWWRERPGLGRWNRSANYSLIISLETEAADVDLYTPIAAMIGIET